MVFGVAATVKIYDDKLIAPAKALLFSIRNGDLKTINQVRNDFKRDLINLYAMPVMKKRGWSSSYLHLVSAQTHGIDLRSLALDILHNGVWINTPDQRGYTPLMEACYAENVKMTNLLIKYGADLSKKAELGLNCLHIAAQKNNLVIARMLLDAGVKPNVHKKNGTTPLMVATEFGFLDMMLLLNSYGAKATRTDTYGMTALHVAAIWGQIEATKILLASGCEINKQDEDGDTPLHAAVANCRYDMARFLMMNGANHKIPNHYNGLPFKGLKPEQLAALRRTSSVIGSPLESPTGTLKNEQRSLLSDERGLLTPVKFKIDIGQEETA